MEDTVNESELLRGFKLCVHSVCVARYLFVFLMKWMNLLFAVFSSVLSEA